MKALLVSLLVLLAIPVLAQDPRVKIDTVRFNTRESTYMMTTEMVNDIPHGLQRVYRNGYLESIYTYSYGEKEGLFVIYHIPPHSKPLTISDVGSYKEDLLEGKWLSYKRDGTFLIALEYHKGKLVK